ncbi:MAG: rhodanese-like domain-containing protein [Dehalococcoidia bacterium]|nr:rhodanese-like domain-containing protein [Dehalococcoidia bacterium]
MKGNRLMTTDQSCKLPGFGPTEAWAEVLQGAAVVDIREPAEFGEAHLPGSINIQYGSKKFAERVTTLIPAGAPLLFLASNDLQSEHCCCDLMALGRTNVIGYLAGGMHRWRLAGATTVRLAQISIHELRHRLMDPKDNLMLLDVRESFEWDELGFIKGSVLIPLGEVERRHRMLLDVDSLALISEHGFRSSTATSLLERLGLAGLMNVVEGIAGWRGAGYPLSEKPRVGAVAARNSWDRQPGTTGPPGKV